MSIETNFNAEENVYVIGVNGKFDSTLAKDFRTAYNAEEARTGNIVIDLDKTSTLDSSALGILLVMQQYLGKQDGEIKIINCNDTVMKIFAITQFGKKFSIV